MARGPSLQIEARLGSRISATLRAELTSLAAESDPELWAAAMLHLAERMERRGQSAEALLLLENLGARGSELPSSAAAILAKAERRRQALLGGGRIGDRAELLIGRFAKESTDPATLASFVAGGTAYKVARGALLARFASSPASILTRGAAARFLAAAGAFGAEVPAFVATAKLGRQALGHAEDWSRTALRTELSSAALSLLFLKSAGALSHRALGGLQASGAWQAAPGMARFAAAALPQAAMFGGILLAHRAETSLGLRPQPQAGSNEWLEALTSLLHFKVGGRLSDGLLGSGYRRAMRELELRVGGGPSFPKVLENSNRTAALAGGPIASAARFFPGLRMSSNENEGENGGKGRLIELFPERSRHQGPKADPTQVDAEAILRLREQLLMQAGALLQAAEANLGFFLSQAEAYAGYLARGGAESVELARLEGRLKAAEERFLEHYWSARSLNGNLAAYSFGIRPGVGPRPPYDSRRGQLQDFLEGAGSMNQGFQAVRQSLASRDPAAVLRSLHDWYQVTPYFMMLEPLHVLAFDSPAPELLRASRLLGMAYGLLARDLYPEPSPSPSSLQMEAMMKLFKILDERGNRPYSRTMIERYYPEGEKLIPTPREGLAQGGSYQEPFRSWFGLHLPALLLHHQGRATAVTQVLSAVDLYMDRTLTETSHQALKWLGYALERGGEPRSWAREESSQSLAGRSLRMALELDPRPELAVKILGAKGPRAILGHALHAFLRAGHDPVLALKTAAGAPETIREEVLGLAGALSGAYAGRGALGRWTLYPALAESWRIEPAKFTAWEKGILALPISRLARPKGFLASPNPVPRTLQSLENFSIRHPKWIAFQDGFLERQTESEILVNHAMRRATDFLTTEAERLQPEAWPKFDGVLTGELKRIEAGVKALRDYFQDGNLRLESSGLSPVLGRPLFEELEGRLQRLEAGFAAYRRFRAEVRLSGARLSGLKAAPDLKSLQEKLLAVIAAFEVPEGSSLESSLPSLLMAEYKERLEAALRETP
ncbi:MAG TPA: hypothetical protein VJR29_03700 [bacterium]|nr:hypothetical protein [bacterium]